MTKTYRLGLNVTPEEIGEYRIALTRVARFPQAIQYPTSFHWLPTGLLTPIKDQADCGSCVAFGTIGAMEAAIKISGGDKTKNIDLSEWFIFTRGGGSCQNGWQIDPALSYLENPGTVDEQCCPYRGNTTCSDWKNRLVVIKTYTRLLTSAAVKNWLATTGPVVAAMHVNDSFFNVDSNRIYTQSDDDGGSYVGDHSPDLVGYDDLSTDDSGNVVPSWDLRNSWGTGWGNNGYCRIQQGIAGILSDFPCYGVTYTVSPTPPGPGPVGPSYQELDITVPSSNLVMTLSYALSLSGVSVLVNGLEYSLASLKKQAVNLGAVKAGDKFMFQLKTSSGTFGFGKVVSFGFGHYFYVQLGSSSGKTDCTVMLHES